ncbi:MAG: N-acetylglucosamine-6-phosphate deacetylase [Sphingomicrobium sp.]
MTTAFVNGRVLIDGRLDRGRAVLVDSGRIEAIVADAHVPAGADLIDLGGGMLVPGFIDTQVNGGGDRLFNDDLSVATIAAIGAAHRHFGTTGFLPTLISDDLDKVEAAIEATRAAIASGVPGVLGVHIEGPFLNEARKGIHDSSKFRPLGEKEIELLSRPTGGRTIVTLAPEEVPPGAIAQLTKAGVIVCAGHTNASADCIFAALKEGLRGFTHLFNAMSPLTSREPGVVGAALYDADSWCGLIVDGHHVDPVVLKLALRAAPLPRFMLVTDAMPSVGGRNATFLLNGETITISEGKCLNAAGTLAGSHLDMASAVRNCVELLDLSVGQAVSMASLHPAAFLGLGGDLGRIAPGQRANLVLLDDELQLRGSWIDGA